MGSAENTWIVWKEDSGKIKLVSKSGTEGMLPKGAYLTINDEDFKCKFILRVDESHQQEPFEPTPLIADMDMSGLSPDRQCKNIVSAYRVKTIGDLDSDLIPYIRPLSIAVRSTQEEIDRAMGSSENLGPAVFVATLFANENRVLRDSNKKPIIARLPEDFYYYQTMICGKTGSGKTVAMKYLAQHFVESKNGAVLAINVKEKDLLTMDQPSSTSRKSVEEEWSSLGEEPHGVGAYTVYYPAAKRPVKGITAEKCGITLRVDDIEPEALTGALTGITDLAVMILPDIFRYWREEVAIKYKQRVKFSDFVEYFFGNSDRKFDTKNVRGDKGHVPLHPGTYESLKRCLNTAAPFFDNEGAKMLDYGDILSPGKMSVIDVTSDIQFGALVLRDILKRLVKAKSEDLSKTDLLIIIDEVHQFYNASNSRDALDDLDTICRTGRSKKMGVIFASQNPNDMPSGISSVVNTKIYFRTEAQGLKDMGTKISSDEFESLKSGFAIASIYGISQLRVMKFPLSLAGVSDESKH